jgi:hypothetical protein
MAAPLNTCTTIEQRGVVRFWGKKYGLNKGYPQRNAARWLFLYDLCYDARIHEYQVCNVPQYLITPPPH